MNNKFTPLDCEDDIILINTDSFKVSRLKEVVIQTIRQKKPWDLGNNITIDTGRFIAYFQNFQIYERSITI